MLQHPFHFRIQILPEKMKQQLIDHYTKYIDELRLLKNSESIINDFLMAINFIKSEDYSHEIANFKKNINQVDNIRGENFVNVFPELSRLINE
jgi:hypothetical protein